MRLVTDGYAFGVWVRGKISILEARAVNLARWRTKVYASGLLLFIKVGY